MGVPKDTSVLVKRVAQGVSRGYTKSFYILANLAMQDSRSKAVACYLPLPITPSC